MAVLLVLGFIDWIQRPDYGLADMLWLFVRQLGIGAVVGLVGRLAGGAGLQARAARHARPLSRRLAGRRRGRATAPPPTIEGSGFLAVYLVGLALGSANIPAKQTITSFHVGLAWVAQLTMFLALGLLIFPSQLDNVALKGTLLALVVVFVARPLATFIATAFDRFSVAERLVLSWAGLRGAVPIVLAIFPVIADVPARPRAPQHRLLRGRGVHTAAGHNLRGLRPAARDDRGRACAAAARSRRPAPSGGLGAEVVEYPVHDDDAIVGLRTRDLGLPREALVNVIVRDGEAIPPRGSTRVEGGDRLHVLVRQEVAPEVRELLERWRTGPIGPGAVERPSLAGVSRVFHTRRWSEEDGDAQRPAEVAGLRVIDRLRSRRDVPGALVLLEDGRYAVTGPVLALGSRQALSDWVRRRIRSGRGRHRTRLVGGGPRRPGVVRDGPCA